MTTTQPARTTNTNVRSWDAIDPTQLERGRKIVKMQPNDDAHNSFVNGVQRMPNGDLLLRGLACAAADERIQITKLFALVLGRTVELWLRPTDTDPGVFRWLGGGKPPTTDATTGRLIYPPATTTFFMQWSPTPDPVQWQRVASELAVLAAQRDTRQYSRASQPKTMATTSRAASSPQAQPTMRMQTMEDIDIPEPVKAEPLPWETPQEAEERVANEERETKLDVDPITEDEGIDPKALFGDWAVPVAKAPTVNLDTAAVAAAPAKAQPEAVSLDVAAPAAPAPKVRAPNVDNFLSTFGMGSAPTRESVPELEADDAVAF